MTKANETKKEDLFISTGPQDTFRLAANLFHRFGAGTVFALHGDLGSGKTCLVQGLAQTLGIREPVCSPTFTLANEYDGAPTALTHIDLYRLEGPDSVLAMGWYDYMDTEGVVAVEWAERAAGLFPAGTVHVDIQMGNTPETRIFSIHRAEKPS